MVRPADGEALGVVAAILLMSASGVIQFADESLNTVAREVADAGLTWHTLEITVELQTEDGKATIGEDYYLNSSSVTLTAGETSNLLPLVTIDDEDVERFSETFSVRLARWGVRGPAVVGSDFSVSATISPSDVPVYVPPSVPASTTALPGMAASDVFSPAAIAGGVTGGVLTLALSSVLAVCLCRRFNPSRARQYGAQSVEAAAPAGTTPSPDSNATPLNTGTSAPADSASSVDPGEFFAEGCDKSGSLRTAYSAQPSSSSQEPSAAREDSAVTPSLDATRSSDVSSASAGPSDSSTLESDNSKRED